ncbi:MAG TPA: Lin0512 family protein [Candidatus Eisenbacteria bacterium]|nr:Lin0512 family protein [Candidatus Eisenbacteria bacterium]
MALVRCVTEMGMGVDVHGLDYTTAAKRAVFDALHHSSLGFQRLVGKSADDMRVDVTIGVPKPEAVDRDAVLATLPHGTGHINVVHGGLQVLNDAGTDGVLIANAIVIVSLDDGR